VRNLGLSTSAAEKLARFLLNLTPEEPKSGQFRANLTLTHEEIAERIGTSRETVTRVFANFKRQQLVDVHGSTLIINKSGLQDILQG
jgi:CRP/FNR family cyclic AMP-dependent transcriptional regulator